MERPPVARSQRLQELSFAKTPHEAILIHVTCYTASLYVIDFTCAPNFGEAVCPGKVGLFSRSKTYRGPCFGVKAA